MDDLILHSHAVPMAFPVLLTEMDGTLDTLNQGVPALQRLGRGWNSALGTPGDGNNIG